MVGAVGIWDTEVDSGLELPLLRFGTASFPVCEDDSAPEVNDGEERSSISDSCITRVVSVVC